MKNDIAGEWEIIARYQYEYGEYLLHTAYEPDTRVIRVASGYDKPKRIIIDGVKYVILFLGVHCAILSSIDREWQIELRRCGM